MMPVLWMLSWLFGVPTAADVADTDVAAAVAVTVAVAAAAADAVAPRE